MSEDKITFTTREEDREYLAEPKQPDLKGKMPRIRARGSQQVDGVRFFAPHLPKEGAVQILGVGIAPCPEEASALLAGAYAEQQVKPRLLKGPCGTLIGDTMNRFSNLFSDQFAYTVMIPWLLPKSRRFKPKKEETAWAVPALHELIAETKPRMILAFGKAAFEQLVDYKISADGAKGGWFTYKDTAIPVYLMDPITVLLTQPWSIDTLITDFREVDRMMAVRYGQLGDSIRDIPLKWQEIRTIEQLENMVAYWEQNNFTRFSVDCEWKGIHFKDGRLRSIQFCWSESEACYLNFFDETGQHHLGATVMTESIEVHIEPGDRWVGPGETYVDYQRVGEILGRWLNRPGITYMGHYVNADSVWMEEWLGLDVWDRCVFDLAFAKQTCNEYSRLGLDVMALEYTNFGRYDLELVMWKKANAKLMKEDEGYGRIPDPILIPYAVLDVVVVWRAYEPVMAELHNQELTGYYRTFVLPFVSNTFHTWKMVGLPVDPMLFDLTRKFFNWAYRALLEDFRNMLTAQADEIVATTTGLPVEVVKALAGQRDAGKAAGALQGLKLMAPDIPDYLADHWSTIRSFNIRSTKDMQRWLFQVLGMTPVKTTKNANNGMPSMLWERVMELPEKLRATLSPAVDKETIEILSATDETGSLIRLLAVSNVGNQCKGFLKEGDVDSEGEVIKENGLAKFIGPDGFLRPSYALTETARPTGFLPNPLNLSKFHNKGVENGLVRVLENEHNNPNFRLPEEFDALFGTEEQRKGRKAKDLVKKDMPSIRSTIKARPGGCFVESDLKTAEVRSLGFQSGDEALLTLLLGVDDSFGLLGTAPVRLKYDPDSGIDLVHQRPEFLFATHKEGRAPEPVDMALLERNEDGSLKHPPFDMHWAVAESSQHKPRELMDYEKDRGAGKVTRFCIAEGELVLTRDRGRVPIQEVLRSDLLWDGLEWVTHAGVVESGYKDVLFYQGLWATAKHEVWAGHAGDEIKMPLRKAIELRLSLQRAQLPAGVSEDPTCRRRRGSVNQICKTYDILDAGPRNRFTCSGVIVANSGTYGAVGATIDRRIEAVTGRKPEPGTGEKMLEAIANAQPVATVYLEMLAAQPKTGQPLIAASGRKRHFPIHSSELAGMPWRIKNSYLRAMGNESKNYPMQESIGAVLARACNYVNNFARKYGMKARTAIGLYDALLTYCPDQSERFVVMEMHQVFLTDINVWHYHNRWMNYPIDTDLCYRWSWKATEDEKLNLYNPEWNAMDENRSKFLLDTLHKIKEDFFALQPDILPRLNVI